MRCLKPEQDNFTYYTVNPVSVPVPTLAKENCRFYLTFYLTDWNCEL